MTVGWLIDASIFNTYYQELAAAVERQGHVAVTVNRPKPPYDWADAGNSYRQAFPQGACVVANADIDLTLKIAADNRWTPGVFATVPHFFCSHYYAHFGEFLLNHDYAMLPFAELPRCRDWLFETFGENDRIFVRPDSPLKIFTGLTIGRSTFEKDYEYMAFYEFPTESLVVVSSPKTIVAEWRYVVADGKVACGSRYIAAGKEVAEPATNPDALKLAESVAACDYSPDPVYVLDVCQTNDGKMHLLEVGGFSFASLYGCDKDLVVQAVSKVAKSIHALR